MYTPTYIRKYETGLVENRENFLIPDDAYPILLNAFIFRERILRKSGQILLGRLRRVLTGQALGNLDGGGNFVGNIRAILSLETNSEIEPGSLTITDGVVIWQDDGLGNMKIGLVNSGTINYVTMALTLSGGTGANPITAAFNYFPGLPVMGLRSRDLNDINNEQMIAFDTKYAYRYVAGFEEFIPGTTWSGNDSDFFWSTNYWVGDNNLKIFWVTNFSGTSGDPIRYTNGVNWADFTPTIDAAGTQLNQCLCLVPFRSRLVAFNTFEGANLGLSTQMRQRIRWSQIGNPFYQNDGTINTINFNVDAWRDDIIGKGGFLDIPTAEDIISVGFVRDNLVIYCERSTWQLRYTGRSIAPFQIEKVNTELGAESTFSAVQFDTSLVGIGDKGVVDCDSYQSRRIDIKIPDLVFRFNNANNGTKRVHGIRDFQQRIAYWCFPLANTSQISPDETIQIFPNRRLVYNYENDSWAIFKDSFTCFGTFQTQSSKRWIDFPTTPWQDARFPWNNLPALFPSIMGGNQQGFVEYLGQYNFDNVATNDISLSITGITGNAASNTATSIECINHNLENGDVIKIVNIPTGTGYASLNNSIFGIQTVDADNFLIFTYNSETKLFDFPKIDTLQTYIGGGKIKIRDNFIIQSKKFNFLDQGESINFGYMDILMNDTSNGAITMNLYINYNDSVPTNSVLEESSPDPFFNRVIPTNQRVKRGSSKNWQRIYCNVRGSFVTLEFTLSNSQLNGVEQENDVQIDAQVLWMRKAGRQLAIGV